MANPTFSSSLVFLVGVIIAVFLTLTLAAPINPVAQDTATLTSAITTRTTEIDPLAPVGDLLHVVDAIVSALPISASVDVDINVASLVAALEPTPVAKLVDSVESALHVYISPTIIIAPEISLN